MKTCPICAQMIQDDAIKCRHCGGWLDKGEEAIRAEDAATGPKFLAVKIYSYLLLVFTALFSTGMIVGVIGSRAGLSGSIGLPELLMILTILAVVGLLIFVALGLLKRKRVAYILNLILLAIGFISGILMFLLFKTPGTRSTPVPMVLLTGAWLAYFAGKKRLFPKRVAAELFSKRVEAEKAAD